MKTVKDMAAQGDIIIRRINKLPEGLKAEPKANEYVIAHSETGHHHVAQGNAQYYVKDQFLAYMVMQGPVTIEHRREYDTHEPLRFLNDSAPEVVYEIRRQREWSPEGWKRVED